MALAVAIGPGVSTVGAAAKAGNQGAAKATEVGVTPDEIHIAVIADVDNAFSPGLFQGSVDGVQGFAKYINNSCKPKNTCVAGRKLVVDFIDSHLNANETRNAVIKACSEDFAMVGTTALFLNNVDDIVNCADKTGSATGLPDIPAFVVELVHQCSPVSFPINPPQLDCSTKDQHPQTYRENAGTAHYYVHKFGKDLHGTFVYSNDLKSAEVGGKVLGAGVQKGGIKADSNVGVSSLAPRSVYTPIAQQIKTDGTNYVLNTGPFSGVVAMRQEAKLQGVNSADVIWDCFSNCYDKRLIEQGGADVEGQYVTLSNIPFNEAKYSKPLASYVKTVGKDKVDGFGAYAWIDSMLFTDVVNQIVKDGGNDALTRKALLDGLGKVHSFDADGMWAKTDVAGRVPSPCFLLVQVKDGEFQRVYPKKPGTFDCKKSNRVETKNDFL